MAAHQSPRAGSGRVAFAIATAAFLPAGCTVAQPKPGHSKIYVGAIRISTPASSGDVVATDVQAIGLGFEDGAWLGWRKGSWVSADPSKCQILVIIRSGVEAAQAARIFEALGGNSPCIVDQSRQQLQ